MRRRWTAPTYVETLSHSFSDMVLLNSYNIKTTTVRTCSNVIDNNQTNERSLLPISLNFNHDKCEQHYILNSPSKAAKIGLQKLSHRYPWVELEMKVWSLKTTSAKCSTYIQNIDFVNYVIIMIEIILYRRQRYALWMILQHKCVMKHNQSKQWILYHHGNILTSVLMSDCYNLRD